MREAVLLTSFLLLSCAPERQEIQKSGVEKYKLTGKILSRDAATNRITKAHDAIPDFMEAMTMAYEVRGARVTDLPNDGSRFEAVIHVGDGAYWITDVRRTPN